MSERTFERLAGAYAEAWQTLIERSLAGLAARVAGQDCVSVDTAIPGTRTSTGRSSRWTWVLPLRYQCFAANGKVVIDYTVERLKTVSTPDGDVRVPLVATERWYNEQTGKPTVEFTYTTDETSLLAVNRDIPDDVFTISPAMARSIHDATYPERSIHPDMELKHLEAEATARVIEAQGVAEAAPATVVPSLDAPAPAGRRRAGAPARPGWRSTSSPACSCSSRACWRSAPSPGESDGTAPHSTGRCGELRRSGDVGGPITAPRPEGLTLLRHTTIKALGAVALAVAAGTLLVAAAGVGRAGAAKVAISTSRLPTSAASPSTSIPAPHS